MSNNSSKHGNKREFLCLGIAKRPSARLRISALPSIACRERAEPRVLWDIFQEAPPHLRIPHLRRAVMEPIMSV